MARRNSGLYLPLDVNFFEDERIIQAGEAAATLYIGMCLKSKTMLSDGILSASQIERLCFTRWRQRLAKLCDYELVMAIGDDAYLITGWSNHNDLKVEVESKRAVDRGRKQAEREFKETVFARDNYRCTYCNTAESLSLDHIKPLIRGGTHDLTNLQTLCKSCNSRKGKRDGTGLTLSQARSLFAITAWVESPDKSPDSHGTVVDFPQKSGDQVEEREDKGSRDCRHGSSAVDKCALCRRGIG